MKARLERNWKVSYVFGREEIVLIEKLFNSIQQAPDIRIVCRDGLTLTPVSFPELLAISNSGMTRIVSARFSAPYTSDINLEIVFANTEYHPIELDVKAEQSEVLRIGAEVEQVVDQCRTWYAFTANLWRPATFGVSWVIGIIALASATKLLIIHRYVSSFVLFFIGLAAFNWQRVLAYFFPLAISR